MIEEGFRHVSTGIEMLLHLVFPGSPHLARCGSQMQSRSLAILVARYHNAAETVG